MIGGTLASHEAGEEETLTIAEAAAATGLTHKAIRNRVDRRQLRAVLRNGVRHIPRDELIRAGLMGGAISVSGASSSEAERDEVPVNRGLTTVEAIIERLHARLEQQSVALGRVLAAVDPQSRPGAVREQRGATIAGEPAQALSVVNDELLKALANIEKRLEAVERRPASRWWGRTGGASTGGTDEAP